MTWRGWDFLQPRDQPVQHSSTVMWSILRGYLEYLLSILITPKSHIVTPVTPITIILLAKSP